MVSSDFTLSAVTALRNIQGLDAAVQISQQRLATGLRIQGARDNASYWSISTSLKSDRAMMNTVHDALNVGAMQVDVAYAGLVTSSDLLAEMRSKLSTAMQDGIDVKAIQEGIKNLQKQLATIAASASVMGKNWLAANSEAPGYMSSASILSSVVSSHGSNTTLGAIDVDLSRIALFDTSPNSHGILDQVKGTNNSTGGIVESRASGSAARAATASTVQYAVDLEKFLPGHKVYFEMEYDGYVTPGGSWPGILVPPGGFSTVNEFAAELDRETANFARVTEIPDTAAVSITSNTLGSDSSISIKRILVYKDLGYTFAAGDPLESLSENKGSEGVDRVVFKAAEVSFAFGPAIALSRYDSIRLDMSVDAQQSKTVVVDRTTVARALLRDDGRIANGSELRDVLLLALLDADVTGVDIGFSNGQIHLKSAASSGTTAISIAKLSLGRGTPILDIDISDKSKTEIEEYIHEVEEAFQRTVSAAAYLGAIGSRIDLQSSFVSNLMSAIDRGVSTLIDADMAEESTRLQSLQVKQQLSLQALSIANRAPNNLLSLFA